MIAVACIREGGNYLQAEESSDFNSIQTNKETNLTDLKCMYYYGFLQISFSFKCDSL